MRVEINQNEKGNYIANIEVDGIELTVEATSDFPGHARYEGTNTDEWYYIEDNYYEESEQIIDRLGDLTNGNSDEIEWV